MFIKYIRSPIFMLYHFDNSSLLLVAFFFFEIMFASYNLWDKMNVSLEKLFNEFLCMLIALKFNSALELPANTIFLIDVDHACSKNFQCFFSYSLYLDFFRMSERKALPSRINCHIDSFYMLINVRQWQLYGVFVRIASQTERPF